jgi:hypothetical protein
MGSFFALKTAWEAKDKADQARIEARRKARNATEEAMVATRKASDLKFKAEGLAIDSDQKAKISELKIGFANLQQGVADQLTANADQKADLAKQQAQAAQERKRQAEWTRKLVQLDLAANEAENLWASQHDGLGALVKAMEAARGLKAIVKKDGNNWAKYPITGPVVALANLLDAVPDRNRLQGHQASVYSVAFSPDGKRIVSGSADQMLRLWDAQTGKPIGEPLQGHQDRVYSVAFSPDGKRIVSGSWDGTMRLWNAPTLDSLLKQGCQDLGGYLSGPGGEGHEGLRQFCQGFK